MRRPRKFLGLIIFLLLVNALFFSVWYPLGGRDWVRNYVARMVGNLVNAKITIGDLHLSDKQILIQDFSYASTDSLLSLQVESFRVRYNLYKLIFSGFKPKNVVSSIEIIEPVARIRYHHSPDPEKRKRSRGEPFEIPDLSGYFRRLTLERGSIEADLAFELKIMSQAPLQIEEGLSKIELRVINENTTNISLSAITSLGGKFSLEGSLDKGRIAMANAEIENFKPLFVSHPDVRDFRSEINVNASYSEPNDGSEPMIEGQALIWNTSAFAINQYPVRIPLINAQTNGSNANIHLSRSRIGNSSIVAELSLQDILGNVSFTGSSARISLIASDIIPQLSGMVEAEVSASGTIREPVVNLEASSSRFAYDEWVFDDITLVAEYRDELATVDVLKANWQNQDISLIGSFAPKTMSFEADLHTSAIASHGQDLMADGSISVSGLILKPYPLINLSLDQVSLSYKDLDLKGISGSASLMPVDQSLLAAVDLSSTEGYTISAVGDVLSQHISADISFSDFIPSALYDQTTLQMLDPIVSGSVRAIMTGTNIWYRGDLKTSLRGEFPYRSDLDLIGNVDIQALSVSTSIIARNSFFNELPADFKVNLGYASNKVRIWSLKLEDILNLSGEVDLADLWNSAFDFSIRNINSAKITQYLPDVAHMIPDFNSINTFARYNANEKQMLDAWLNINDVDLLSVVPLNINLFLKGNLSDIAISGNLNHKNHNLLKITGMSSLKPELNLALQASMNNLRMQDVLTSPPGTASISGITAFEIKDILAKDAEMAISADLVAKEINFGEFTIDHARIKAAQDSKALIVDSLYVHAKDLFTATAKGSLDYNALQNTFLEGDRNLKIIIDGEFFPWLKELTDYVVSSRGNSNVELTLGTAEDQFTIESGFIKLSQGMIHLKDQVEPIRDIEFTGVFENNRLMIQRGTFNMGNGRFNLSNLFDPEPSDHFMVSFLDLGYFRILIEEPGIQATIPVVAPPRTLTNVAIRGLDGRYATIRGPFDDMKIEALVTASNLDILFPPGADNLLNLIMSVRNTGKKPDSDPVPLPFKLDLQLIIGENVRYVTYPTNLYLAPGGFLHLIYDGSRFIVQEANIVSDRGSIDFFGTVFQVDNIAISMIDQQNILSVTGQFYKRTPDGSTIMLTVSSTPEYDKDFFDRLQISLTSDNPQDQNISQVLARLRYNQSMDQLPDDQKQTLLQDEALGLIGGNLNSTVLTPFFYPVENWVRRTLKLDGFSINAGFIQNIFTEYSSNPSQLADMADLSNLSADITQFSSSILLNNLSISMSKYLGYRVFADYELGLQEATDLQQKTRILVSHDTSLRLLLPRQFRLGYTLNYAPKQTEFTHEIMLQKSWRFWGF